MTSVIAHRGASRAETENTVAAFRRAGAMGADGVELDVRRTADDRLVVHHDPHLADGRVIRETDSTELPAGVPDLASALDACDGMFVNVEIKNEPGEPDFDPTDWVLHRTLVELGRRGGGTRWLISSFRPETVERCRLVAAGFRTAWLVYALDEAVVERAAAIGHHAVHPWVDLLEESAVRRAHAAGLTVNAWTCNDPQRARELIAWGVDGICTDVPDLVLDVRRGS